MCRHVLCILLKCVASEARTEELKSQLRKVGTAFLTCREVSVQEAVQGFIQELIKFFSGGRKSLSHFQVLPKYNTLA